MRGFRAASFIWMVAPVAALAAEPASVEAPAYRVGDTWVIQESTQMGANGFTQQRVMNVIDRVSSDEMLLGVKPDGSPRALEDHRVGLDLSQKLLVNGSEAVTTRPLSFPLALGRTWTADWTDPRVQGQQISAHFHKNYKVVGWEDVTVPAGTFHALKIEGKGYADGEIALPAQATQAAAAGGGGSTIVSHTQSARKIAVHQTLLETIYYAPEAKFYVKMIEEQYNASDILTQRHTVELASFTLAK